MLRLRAEAEHSRQEVAELRAELTTCRADSKACRTELVEALSKKKNEAVALSRAAYIEGTEASHVAARQSGMGRLLGEMPGNVYGGADASQLASCQSDLVRVSEERDQFMFELDAKLTELTRTRNQLQRLQQEDSRLERERHVALDRCEQIGRETVWKPHLEQQHILDHQYGGDNLDVDVAVHAAAVNVAVRAELEAARKAGQSEVQQARTNQAHHQSASDQHFRLIGADNRARSLSSQLRSERALTSEATDALQD